MDKVTVGNDSLTNPQSASMGQENGNENTQINAGAIRKSTTSSILTALSNASGQNFESVEGALSYIARTSATSNNNTAGHVQPIEEPVQKNAGRVTNNDLQEQFQRLQNDLASKEQSLRVKELDSDISRAMGDKFDPDLVDLALQKVKSNVQWNNDGTYSIVNAKGQERYGMDGNPLTIQGLVNEVGQGNPKLLKMSNLSSGSGLRPGQGNFAGAPHETMPDYAKDPAAFNNWAKTNGLGKNVGLKIMSVTATNSLASQKIL
jgi:hypothetical protein